MYVLSPLLFFPFQLTRNPQRGDVVRALHAEKHPGAWTECKTDVHRAFKESTEQSSITVLPRVLSKIPVMIFAGDQDLICNYVGLENMIKELTWNGAQGLGVRVFLRYKSTHYRIIN